MSSAIPPTIPGSINVDSININNVVGAVDKVVNKGFGKYVMWKTPVKVATTAPITLSGQQTIDDVACVAGDRVLVKDQVETTLNGVYVVSTIGWKRANDFALGFDAQGAFFFVKSGTVGGGNIFMNDTATVVGAALTFKLFTVKEINAETILAENVDAENVFTDNLTVMDRFTASGQICGVSTLVGGTVVVSGLEGLTSNDLFFVSRKSVDGPQGHLRAIYTSETSFTITSSEGTDIGEVYWMVVRFVGLP